MRADLELLRRGKSVKCRYTWQRNLSYAKKSALVVTTLGLVAGALFLLPISKWQAPTTESSRNPEADEAYRKGYLAFHQNSGDSLPEAVKYFERAVELDPKFVAAWAALAGAYNWSGPDDPQFLEKSRMAAQKVFSLDKRLARTRNIFGWSKALLEHDWKGAEKGFLEATRLNPNSENALYSYASFLVITGRTNDAVRQVEKARQLDSHSVLFAQNAAFVFLASRQFDRAISTIENVIEREPSTRARLTEQFLLGAYREKGDYLTAIQLEKELALLAGEKGNELSVRCDSLRNAYTLGGEPKYWEQLLAWNKDNESDPVTLAALYARVGNGDEAIHYLNLALEKTPTQLTFRINREPAFDRLRNDNRFVAVLGKLGLPQ